MLPRLAFGMSAPEDRRHYCVIRNQSRESGAEPGLKGGSRSDDKGARWDLGRQDPEPLKGATYI